MLEWTAQTAVIAAVLAGAVALACRTRRIGPVARHALWTVVLVKLLLPPMFVLEMPWRTSAALAPVVDERPVEPVPVSAAFVATDVADVTLRPSVPESISISPSTSRMAPTSSRLSAVTVVLGVWLTGALIFFLVQSTRVVRLGRRVREGVDADPALAADVADVARGLGVSAIRTRVVDGLTSPVMWCLQPRRPQLLWPAYLSDELSPACRRALVVHELAHVKRRDHWVGWVELVAGCAWWWNPMFWYTRAQVRENAELACDGWVIHALPNGRRAYAEALLTICSSGADAITPMPVLSAGGGSRRILERRLTMIMKGHIPVRLPRIGIASVIALAALALPAWAQRPFDAAQGRPVVVTTATSTPQTATTVVTTRPVVAVEVPPEPGQRRVVITQPQVATTVQTEPQRERINRLTAQRTPLPEDAQKLLQKFEEQTVQARKEFEAKIQEQQAGLIKELQALQDSYTKAGKLDEAVAVRDRIRQLQATPNGQVSWILSPDRTYAYSPRGYTLTTRSPAPGTGLALSTRGPRSFVYRRGEFVPGADTLEDLRAFVGRTFTIPVVGIVTGPVWGTGTYSDDSSVSTAAVHAGLVENGKLGFVKVTILPGLDKYEGSTSHGVTSQSWNEHHGGSFKLERESSSSPVLQMTSPDGMPLWTLAMLRGQSNVSLLVEVVGTNDTVWGTDIYTDDSSIGGAAVHAGILKVGEKGTVKITLLGAQDSYRGSDRNGISSQSFGAWPGSFKIERK